jgi:transcriptional regulator with XRE-family HTH domain
MPDKDEQQKKKRGTIGHSAPKLREIRQSLGMSQYDVADATGFARSTIHSLENGVRRGQGKTLRTVAAALGVNLYELTAGALGSVDDPVPTLVRGEGVSMAKGMVSVASPRTDLSGHQGEIRRSVDPEEIREDLAHLRDVPIELFLYGGEEIYPEDVRAARDRVRTYYAEHGYKHDTSILEGMPYLTGEDTAAHYVTTNRR